MDRLAEHWTRIDGVDVFYRESTEAPADAPVMVHLHGFGLSGRYLLPTAERLATEYRTYVPDLPGFGRSWRAPRALDVPGLAQTAARFLDDRGIERATLVGNSMGCPVITEFAYRFPDRIDRAVLVSPAGEVVGAQAVVQGEEVLVAVGPAAKERDAVEAKGRGV